MYVCMLSILIACAEKPQSGNTNLNESHEDSSADNFPQASNPNHEEPLEEQKNLTEFNIGGSTIATDKAEVILQVVERGNGLRDVIAKIGVSRIPKGAGPYDTVTFQEFSGRVDPKKAVINGNKVTLTKAGRIELLRMLRNAKFIFKHALKAVTLGGIYSILWESPVWAGAYLPKYMMPGFVKYVESNEDPYSKAESKVVQMMLDPGSLPVARNPNCQKCHAQIQGFFGDVGDIQLGSHRIVEFCAQTIPFIDEMCSNFWGVMAAKMGVCAGKPGGALSTRNHPLRQSFLNAEPRAKARLKLDEVCT